MNVKGSHEKVNIPRQCNESNQRPKKSRWGTIAELNEKHCLVD